MTKKGMYYCVFYNDGRYWGRLINVFSNDVDDEANEVEMDFLQYKGNNLWEFPTRSNKEIIKSKCLFYGPCTPSVITKRGYQFREDEEANNMYKLLKA